MYALLESAGMFYYTKVKVLFACIDGVSAPVQIVMQRTECTVA